MRSAYSLLLLLLVSKVFSQAATECSRTLARAEEAFEQGRLLYILDKNQNLFFYECLNGGGFSKDELVRAHKLLTKAYLFTDNEIEAEKSFINLLGADKEHLLTSEDPAELYFLYSKFKTEPIFRLGLRAGPNKSMPLIIQSHSEKQYNGEGNETGPGINWWAELIIERHIKNGFEVGLGANLWNLTYQMQGTIADVEDGIYSAKNRSTWLKIPVMGRYNFNYDKKNQEGQRLSFVPYVFAGASYDILISAKYVDASRQIGQPYTLPEEEADLKAAGQVAESNASFFVGVGTKMRVGRSKVDFVSFEVRYDNQLFNYIDPDNRYANSAVWEDIGLVEDDLTVNAVSFSLGYTRSFYLPRKRKQYR